MFLPDNFGQTQPQDGVSSITPSNPETTSEDITLMQRVLAAASRNPNLIPSDFMSYVLDYIQAQGLQIPLGQVFGYQSSVNSIVANAVAQALAGQFKVIDWTDVGFSMPNNTTVGPNAMPTVSGLVSGGSYILMGGAHVSANSSGTLAFSSGLSVALDTGGGAYASAQVIASLSGTSITATLTGTGSGAGGSISAVWAWALRTA